MRRSRKGEDWSEAAWMGGDLLDSLAGIALFVVAVAVAVLLVAVLLPLLGLLFEIGLVAVLIGSGVFGRLVLRRPWTIQAVALDDPTRAHRFEVVGWRRSRRAIAELSSAIATTGVPARLAEAQPA